MSLRILFGAGFCAVLAACSSLEPLGTGSDQQAEFSRQILVTARQGASAALGLVGDPSTVYLRRSGYGATASVERLLDQIAREHDLKRVDGWLISSLGVYCEIFELSPDQDRDIALRRLQADPRIESAQAMHVYETEGIRYDDPLAEMQPALTAMSIDAVHEFATGRGVTVAVIDSMVDGRHPEIRGRVPVRRNLVRSGKRRGGGEIHGTAVAGVIASMANNSEGIVGVAPDARIESLRACWTVDEASGRAVCSSFSLAQALEVALSSGVEVINLSLSGPDDPLVGRLINAALEREVVIVAATPDGAMSIAGFPATHPGVIAVGRAGSGAMTRANTLMAPGDEILSLAPGDGYAFFSGNSMSSAFVSGVAALLLEHRPEITVHQIFDLLAQTSTSDSIDACQAFARLTLKGDCSVSVSEAPGSALRE